MSVAISKKILIKYDTLKARMGDLSISDENRAVAILALDYMLMQAHMIPGCKKKFNSFLDLASEIDIDRAVILLSRAYRSQINEAR